MCSKAKFTEKIRILSKVGVGAIGGGNSTLFLKTLHILFEHATASSFESLKSVDFQHI